MRHGNELVLFAYLLLERGRRISRDEASAAIWPERRPEHESAALRTVLSRLKAALPGDVLVRKAASSCGCRRTRGGTCLRRKSSWGPPAGPVILRKRSTSRCARCPSCSGRF